MTMTYFCHHPKEFLSFCIRQKTPVKSFSAHFSGWASGVGIGLAVEKELAAPTTVVIRPLLLSPLLPWWQVRGGGRAESLYECLLCSGLPLPPVMCSLPLAGQSASRLVGWWGSWRNCFCLERRAFQFRHAPCTAPVRSHRCSRIHGRAPRGRQ
jgi:hypothetical protein